MTQILFFLEGSWLVVPRKNQFHQTQKPQIVFFNSSNHYAPEKQSRSAIANFLECLVRNLNQSP
jgi:hypothetical protein